MERKLTFSGHFCYHEEAVDVICKDECRRISGSMAPALEAQRRERMRWENAQEEDCGATPSWRGGRQDEEEAACRHSDSNPVTGQRFALRFTNRMTKLQIGRAHV